MLYLLQSAADLDLFVADPPNQEQDETVDAVPSDPTMATNLLLFSFSTPSL
jgi:hypothetical protein